MTAEQPRAERAAARLGITEGQLYTLILSLAVIAFAAGVGFPQLHRVRSSGALPTLAVPEPAGLDRASAAAHGSDLQQGPFTSSGASGRVNGPATTSGPSPENSPPVNGPLAGAGTTVEPIGTATTFGPPMPGVTGPIARLDGRTYLASGAALRVVNRDGSDGGTVHLSRAVTGLAADNGSLLAVTDHAEMLRVDPTSGRAARIATIPDIGLCVGLIVANANCEVGVIDHSPSLVGIATDSTGDALIADRGQASVWRVTKDGKISHVVSDRSFLNLRGTDGLAGITLDATRTIVVSTVGLTDAGLFLIRQNADGSAAVASLATFDQADQPDGVALRSDGGALVALTGKNRVAVLDPSGHETNSFPTSGTTLDHPRGLAIEDAQLYVTYGSGVASIRVA